MFLIKKWGILIKKESESLIFIGLKIPRDYSYALEDEFAGYDRSIDTYIKSIRQKVEPDGKMPRYFVTVYGVGYKFVL